MASNDSSDQLSPLELVIPRRIVLTRRSFEEILERMMKDKTPPPALVALMHGFGEE